VQTVATDKSDRNDDDDRMEDMIADIDMEHDLGSRDQHLPLEVHKFYMLLATSDEKVHNDTN
jgi:hypothetical protein